MRGLWGLRLRPRRAFTQAEFNLLNDPLPRALAFEGGQLIQGLQAQIVKELSGGAVQRWPAHRLTVANHLDPAAVFQLLEQQRIDGYAANIFHIAPGDRLAVGNDGQGL